MRTGARAELNNFMASGNRVGHKDVEGIYSGVMVLVVCSALGDEATTSHVNTPKDSGGRWKLAEMMACDDHCARRHLVFEYISK